MTKKLKKVYQDCPCAMEGPHSGGGCGTLYDSVCGRSHLVFMPCKHHESLYQKGFKKLTVEEMAGYNETEQKTPNYDLFNNGKCPGTCGDTSGVGNIYTYNTFHYVFCPKCESGIYQSSILAGTYKYIAPATPKVHDFGGFILDYDSKCPNNGSRCSGAISGKVFHLKTSPKNKWFTGCEYHTKQYLESCKNGVYTLVHDPDGNYDLYKYSGLNLIPKVTSLSSFGGLKSKPEEAELGLNPGLYHMIYRFGSVSYHLCTYADSEEAAKEKVIREESINFDKDFSDEIRKGKANRVINGVWKNGRY